MYFSLSTKDASDYPTFVAHIFILFFFVDGDGEVQIPISGGWNSYDQRAFTTGRRHVSTTKSRPKGISQTLKVYGIISKKICGI